MSGQRFAHRPQSLEGFAEPVKTLLHHNRGSFSFTSWANSRLFIFSQCRGVCMCGVYVAHSNFVVVSSEGRFLWFVWLLTYSIILTSTYASVNVNPSRTLPCENTGQLSPCAKFATFFYLHIYMHASSCGGHLDIKLHSHHLTASHAVLKHINVTVSTPSS